MAYTLIRRCESCARSFRARCEPGEPWPAVCATCSPARTTKGTRRKPQPTRAMRKAR